MEGWQSGLIEQVNRKDVGQTLNYIFGVCLMSYHCKFCEFKSEKVSEIGNHVKHKHKRKYQQCIICKKEIESSQINQHMKACEKKKNHNNITIEIETEELCEYGCGQTAKYQLKNGKKVCSKYSSSCPSNKEKNSKNLKESIQKDGRKSSKGFKWSKQSPTKGKTLINIVGKEKAEEIGKKISSTLKKLNIENGSIWNRLSEEKREVIRKKASDRMKQNYLDGKEYRCGRAKKYKYYSTIAGNIYLDGLWELQIAKYFDELNLIWYRNKKRFPYINIDGKQSTYCPDFWVKDWDTFIEIKGYQTDLDICKWKQFPERLQIWNSYVLIELKLIKHNRQVI